MANSFEADSAAASDPAVGSAPAVALDWRVDSRAGISLVELTVTNSAGTPRRVRLGNRLDGPVCPPRREGVPEAGWDDGGFEGVLAPGERRALGYAARAPPADPPVEVVWTERAGDSETDGNRVGTPGGRNASDGNRAETDGNRAGIDRPGVEATPEGVVRALGDARPPADAVPVPAVDDDGGPSEAESVPDSVDAWLSAVETRADDGTADPSGDDRPALDAVARRIGALRDRADESATGGSP